MHAYHHPHNNQREILLLMALGLLLFGAGLGLRDAWPADEPRFAVIALEMVRNHQWLIPHIGGTPYSDKPPLFIWAIAIPYALTGSMRLAFLLPSLLSALLVLWLVYDLGCRLWNAQIGLAAGLLLLFTVQFTLQARQAQADMLLCLWTTLGLYGLLRHLYLGPDWRWYALSGVAMGCGVLTKGVGFLPLLALPAYLALRVLRWPALPRLPALDVRWLSAPLLMLITTGLWVLPMALYVQQSGDPALFAYRHDILFRQTAQRYAQSWNHVAPWWYYLTQLPWLWQPALLTLPWVVPGWWRALRQHDARIGLLLGYVLLVIVFFSLSPGKRGEYLLPALPALALGMAPLLPASLRKPGMQWLSWLLALLLALAVLGVAVYVGYLKPARGLVLAAAYQLPDSTWLGLTLVGGLSLLLVLWLRPRRGVWACCLLLAMCWVGEGLWLYPLLNPSRSGLALMQKTAQLIGPKAELALVGWKEQLLLQADRPVVNFGYRRQDLGEVRKAITWLAQAPDRWVLLPENRLKPCFDASQARFVLWAHDRNWYLVNHRSVLDCAP